MDEKARRKRFVCLINYYYEGNASSPCSEKKLLGRFFRIILYFFGKRKQLLFPKGRLVYCMTKPSSIESHFSLTNIYQGHSKTEDVVHVPSEINESEVN
jgi:hypothetical protein